nr:MAG: hypothetical protein TU36_01245 [Vulcanisaeta sp. AZ3]
MNVLGFVITTVALLVLAIFFVWYLNNYIATNIINTVSYTSSLVSSALIHEFQNAIVIASMQNVVGTFNYTLMLPTSAIPVQGVALTYTVTLYPRTINNQTLLYANVTITMTMGPISRSQRTTVLLYSSKQPYTITAYNCLGSQGPVQLISPNEAGTGVSCTWTSAEVEMGKAVISISKP